MDYNKNYYNILGLNNNASESDIKKAYRKLSIKYHPDKNPNDTNAENKFKEVNEANGVLSKPDKKKEYDTRSPHGASYNPNSGNPFGGNPFGGSGHDFYDGFFSSFESMFESMRGGGRGRREFIEKLDIQVVQPVTLDKVYNNEVVNFKYEKYITCTTCSGSGTEPSDDDVECAHCEGTNPDCRFCGGTGRISDTKCTKCNGKKVIKNISTVKIKDIFKIAISNLQFRYTGYGNHSRFYPGEKGDLLINVVLENQTEYDIEGVNLIKEIDVDFRTIILGGIYYHKHLDGKTYKIKIGEKSNNKHSLRVKGKGLLHPNGQIRGDLYLKLNVNIDYNTLTESDIEYLKKIQKEDTKV